MRFKSPRGQRLLIGVALLVVLSAAYLGVQQLSLSSYDRALRRRLDLRRVEPAHGLIVLLITAQGREDIVRSGRQWRKGLPTIIYSNVNATVSAYEAEQHNETWLTYPDNDLRFSLKSGDFRAALAPFLAYRHLGSTFKWLLYGDDDTIFFPHGVLSLLKAYDPAVPYIITDWIWGHDGHWTAHNLTPRCLPCHAEHLASCADGLNREHFQPPIGCPCTPEVLCEALHNDTVVHEFMHEMCNGTSEAIFRYPDHWERVYAVHGGAGAAMSIGLLEAVTLEQMENCTLRLCERRQTGGDAIIATCLWSAGYGLTDPGIAVCAEDWARNKLFGGGDYSSGADIGRWLRHALQGNGSNPCDPADASCTANYGYLQRMATTHLGANTVFKNFTRLTRAITEISADYVAVMRLAKLTSQFGRAYL